VRDVLCDSHSANNWLEKGGRWEWPGFAQARGLISGRFADVPGGGNLIHSLVISSAYRRALLLPQASRP